MNTIEHTQTYEIELDVTFRWADNIWCHISTWFCFAILMMGTLCNTFTLYVLKKYTKMIKKSLLPLTFKSLDKTLENIFKVTNEILPQHCTSFQ